ncbi:hypothetical protein KDL01_41100 [Actinospica durhamensis]|uniref:Uncharacterized protein n=1 Tax=Actinospica durhamensis TaxID=1508375 RepID=A0A941EWV3_9ACTN|nr:hypothetical protein [Actinospica durhamensis]MBR7839720.1 hypothetical protein [Actinospica durhamensis]
MNGYPEKTGLILNGKRLREAREALNMSQAAFARAIQDALRGTAHQEARPTKRLVQKWESGQHATPQPHYQRAITAVTGTPYRNLCHGAPPLDVRTTAQQLRHIHTELFHLSRQLEVIVHNLTLAEL